MLGLDFVHWHPNVGASTPFVGQAQTGRRKTVPDRRRGRHGFCCPTRVRLESLAIRVVAPRSGGKSALKPTSNQSMKMLKRHGHFSIILVSNSRLQSTQAFMVFAKRKIWARITLAGTKPHLVY